MKNPEPLISLVAANTPHAQISFSKRHFPLEEPGLLGEMAGFRFRPRNVQGKPRSPCHPGNQGCDSCVKGLRSQLSTSKKSNYSGSEPLNLLKFSGL